MSLTNPNTVVTEQRLNDFYKGILPYLGGMPEIVANKFSKGDLYSTEEKMIGQWTNGKPLYQKTIVDTMADTVNTFKAIDIGANVDYVQMVSGALVNGTTIANFNGVSSDLAGCFICTINTNANKISLLTSIAGYVSKPCYITIQYTKSTDSAISIGDANDYSTEEKIVGTWVGGEPIYQKTIVMTMPTTTSRRDGAFWQGDASVDVTSLNISQLVNLTAMSSYPSICNLIPYFGYATEVEATQYAKMNAIMCWCNKSTISIRRYTPSSVNADAGADVYVTIQYTKTTS